MTPEIQALRERFRDQMPGLSVFDELATKYERLLQAQATIDQRWSQASPETVKRLREQVQAIVDTAELTPETRAQLVTAIKGASR